MGVDSSSQKRMWFQQGKERELQPGRSQQQPGLEDKPWDSNLLGSNPFLRRIELWLCKWIWPTVQMDMWAKRQLVQQALVGVVLGMPPIDSSIHRCRRFQLDKRLLGRRILQQPELVGRPEGNNLPGSSPYRRGSYC